MYKIFIIDRSGLLIASYPSHERISIMSHLIIALRRFSQEVFGKPFSGMQIEGAHLLVKELPDGVTVVLLAPTKDGAFLNKISVVISRKIRELKEKKIFAHGLLTPEVEKEVERELEKAFYFIPPYGLVDKLYQFFHDIPTPMTPPIANKWMEIFETSTNYLNDMLKSMNGKVDLEKAKESLIYLAKRNLRKAFEYAVESSCTLLARSISINLGITIGGIPSYAVTLMDKISEKDIRYFLINSYNYYYGDIDFIMPFSQMISLTKEFIRKINLNTPEGIGIASLFLPIKIEIPIPEKLKDFISPLELKILQKQTKFYQIYEELFQDKTVRRAQLLEFFSYLIETLKEVEKYIKTDADKTIYTTMLAKTISTFIEIIETFNIDLEEAKDVANLLIRALERNLKNVERLAYVGISLDTLSRSLLGGYACMRIHGTFNKKILEKLIRLVIPHYYPFLEKKIGKINLLNGIMLQHMALTLKEERLFKSKDINSMLDTLLSRPIIDKEDILKLFESARSRNIEYALWCLEAYTILLMKLANNLSSREVRSKLIKKLIEFDHYLMFELNKRGIEPLFFKLEKQSLM